MTTKNHATTVPNRQGDKQCRKAARGHIDLRHTHSRQVKQVRYSQRLLGPQRGPQGGGAQDRPSPDVWSKQDDLVEFIRRGTQRKEGEKVMNTREGTGWKADERRVQQRVK